VLGIQARDSSGEDSSSMSGETRRRRGAGRPRRWGRGQRKRHRQLRATGPEVCGSHAWLSRLCVLARAESDCAAGDSIRR
jgi:hypothetical protein